MQTTELTFLERFEQHEVPRVEVVRLPVLVDGVLVLSSRDPTDTVYRLLHESRDRRELRRRRETRGVRLVLQSPQRYPATLTETPSWSSTDGIGNDSMSWCKREDKGQIGSSG